MLGHPVSETRPRHPLANVYTSSQTLHDETGLLPKNDKVGGDPILIQKTTGSFMTPILLRRLCLVLHILLVILHFLLLGVWITRAERNIVVSFGRESTVSVVMVQVSQIFITIYTAALVVLVQRLNLQRNLFLRQTLTAVHDKCNAWGGLGSAILGLWQQTSVKATVWGTLSVAVYLTCMAVLHITTPSLFSLDASNDASHVHVNTTLGVPSIDINSGFTEISGKDSLLREAASVLPFLSRFNPIQTIGVHGSTLYDFPRDNIGVGNMSVNATTFHVSCGYLGNISQAVPPAVDEPNFTGSERWSLFSDYNDYDFVLSIPYIISGVVQTYVTPFQDKYLGRNLLFYSSVNFTDSTGATGSVVPLPVQNGTTIASVQVMGCTLAYSSQTAIIDAPTKALLAVTPPVTPNVSEWQLWTPQAATPDPQSSSPNVPIADPLIDIWKYMFLAAPQTSTIVSRFCKEGGTEDTCDYLTALESFTLSQIAPVNFLGALDLDMNLTLDDLQNALANTTAMLYWAAMQYKGIPSNLCLQCVWLTPQVGDAVVGILAFRWKLNLYSLLLGIVTSVTALVLSSILIRRAGSSNSTIESMGVLQVIWLMRRRPELQALISQVDKPNVEHLRRAGMVSLTLVGDDVDISGAESGQNTGRQEHEYRLLDIEIDEERLRD